MNATQFKYHLADIKKGEAAKAEISTRIEHILNLIRSIQTARRSCLEKIRNTFESYHLARNSILSFYGLLEDIEFTQNGFIYITIYDAHTDETGNHNIPYSMVYASTVEILKYYNDLLDTYINQVKEIEDKKKVDSDKTDREAYERLKAKFEKKSPVVYYI